MAYTVVKMPSLYESTTGYVYMNTDDIRSEFVKVGDLIYRCLPHSNVLVGNIAMNSVQRSQVGERTTYVTNWTLPASKFELTDITIYTDWRIRDTSRPPPDIYGPFRSHFGRQVLTDGQEVALYIDDNLIVCRIKCASQGMMTRDTQIKIYSKN